MYIGGRNNLFCCEMALPGTVRYLTLLMLVMTKWMLVRVKNDRGIFCFKNFIE